MKKDQNIKDKTRYGDYSLFKDNESWDDVIAGFSLINNLNQKEEELLDNIITYLDEEYPDMFNSVVETPSLPDYEYEMFINDKGTPFEINTWVPIATSKIKDISKIDKYIKKGLIRKI
jgi:hypothetical protein